MRAAQSTLLAGTLVVVAVASPRAAHADEPYRLAWSRAEGAEACLSEAELAQRVRGRLGREPFDERADRTIEGQVGLGSDGFLAKLVIRGADSSVLGRRTIETRGPDCGSLGQAVTLAVVLTIDPNAPLDASEPAPQSPAPPSAPPPPQPAPSPSPSPVVTPTRTPPVIDLPPVVPPREDRARASIAAGVVGAAGLLPRAAVGFELEGAFPASPSGLVLGLRVLPSADTSDGHLGVGVTSGKIGFCWSVVANAGVGLCGAFEAGVTTVVARDLEPVSPGDYPFLALSAGARVVVPTRGPLAFQAGAAAVVPLYRHRFQVESANAQGFRVSAVGGVAFLGVRLGG